MTCGYNILLPCVIEPSVIDPSQIARNFLEFLDIYNMEYLYTAKLSQIRENIIAFPCEQMGNAIPNHCMEHSNLSFP